MGRGAAFWVFGGTLGFFLLAAAAPSPLYAVYAADWHFGSLEVTEVFAVYAIVLLLALLVTGALSDAVGRRRVVLAALVLEVLSMALFAAAGGVGWLFAARILQGLATGVATGALAASLVDLEPRPGMAPVVNSVAPVAGLALGALGSAALVQYGPDPLHLVYWLLAVAFLGAGAAVLLAPEPARSRAELRLRPRVAVDSAARPAFLAALPTLVAGWGVGSFYFSLGPSLALQLAGSSDRLLGGLLLFVLAGVGAAAVLALNGWPARRAVTLGVGALIGGAAFTLIALAAGSIAALFGATVVTGVGFGLAWLGVLRSLIARATPTSRGALLAAAYIVSYVAFAVPAVIAGYLVGRIGLHDAALWYAGATGVLALVGLGGTLLERSTEVAA